MVCQAVQGLGGCSPRPVHGLVGITLEGAGCEVASQLGGGRPNLLQGEGDAMVEAHPPCP